MKPPEEKRRLTPTEAKAREERLRKAGITVAKPGTSVITLLARTTSAPVEETRR